MFITDDNTPGTPNIDVGIMYLPVLIPTHEGEAGMPACRHSADDDPQHPGPWGVKSVTGLARLSPALLAFEEALVHVSSTIRCSITAD